MSKTKYKYKIRCDEFYGGKKLYLPLCKKKGWFNDWRWIDRTLFEWAERRPDNIDFMTLDEAHNIIYGHEGKLEAETFTTYFIKFKKNKVNPESYIGRRFLP